jgi:hypothetical protein
MLGRFKVAFKIDGLAFALQIVKLSFGHGPFNLRFDQSL